MTGSLLATFTPDPDPYLGIRCVSWHPTGLFIAAGGYEDKVGPSNVLPNHFLTLSKDLYLRQCQLVTGVRLGRVWSNTCGRSAYMNFRPPELSTLRIKF